MYFISHRGNINGPDTEKENHPSYIMEAVNMGYDVEIDVWYINENYYLGHDYPRYLVSVDFLKNKKFWCHAKNHDALNEMLNEKIHCFWHQNDDVTLTSKSFIWAYPKKSNIPNRIEVILDESIPDNLDCTGYCSDYIQKLKGAIL